MKLRNLLIVVFATFAAGRTSADDSAAARVNGVPIPAAAVDKLAAKIAAGAKTPVESIWDDARDQLITLEVLLQQANAEKLSVSPDEVDKEVGNFKTQLGGQQQFLKNLEDSKSTPEQFREETRRSLVIEKLLDRHVTVKVGDKEIESYYKENRDQFDRPEMVRASHILIKVPSPEAADAARKRATQVLERAKKGEDFAKLAKDLSDDDRTKSQGGDLGFFPLRPTQVAEAAFKLKIGEVSDIVESSYGLHIIKAVARRPAGVAPLAEVKVDIRSMLEDDQRDDNEDAYVEGLKKKAKIEVLIRKKGDTKSSAQQ